MRRVVYFFTSFPVLSETFLQREVRGLLQEGVELELVSLWKGSQEFDGHPVHRFRLWQLWVLLWKLPWLCLTRWKTMKLVLKRAFFSRYPNRTNWLENLLGFGAGIALEGRYRRNPPSEFHAVWGSMPAATAWILRDLMRIPFSMAAHAYDIFEDGGDRWLSAKLRAAHWVQTSTDYARRELIQRGAEPDRLLLVRRSLEPMPAFVPRQKLSEPLRILSVGRLVPKKGYGAQLQIYRALKDAGIRFRATIVGGGPEEGALRRLADQLELTEELVKFAGVLPFEQVGQIYRESDLFFFTGKIAPDGDRDGLPNVLPEAMAYGLVVCTSAVSGTVEAITDRENGRVLDLERPSEWVDAVRELLGSPDLAHQYSRAGRAWVEREFDATRNAQTLAQWLEMGPRASR